MTPVRSADTRSGGPVAAGGVLRVVGREVRGPVGGIGGGVERDGDAAAVRGT